MNPSRASRVFQRETPLKPAFRTCFENAPSKRGLRRNFFFPHFIGHTCDTEKDDHYNDDDKDDDDDDDDDDDTEKDDHYNDDDKPTPPTPA